MDCPIWMGVNESEDPSAQCGDKRGFNRAQAINKSYRQRVKTRRSDNTVQKDAGKREVSENIENGVKTGRSDNTQNTKTLHDYKQDMEQDCGYINYKDHTRKW